MSACGLMPDWQMSGTVPFNQDGLSSLVSTSTLRGISHFSCAYFRLGSVPQSLPSSLWGA